MKVNPLTTLIGALVLCLPAGLTAAPVISEFLASNDASLADEDGEFSDWIEIYNPDATAVNLDGYFLTDDAADLTGWEFPAATIDPGGYLLVFASNKDRRDPAAELHANFRLSAGGGYLALVAADGTTVLSEFGPVYPEQFEDQSFGRGTFGAVTTETLVADGASGRYFMPTDDSLGTGWRDRTFDDSAWILDTAGIGWETPGRTLEPAIATNISDLMKGENASCYFRFEFDYSSANKQLQSLGLRMTIDDGFVAFVNGQQVASYYAPENPTWDSTATEDDTDAFVLSDPRTYTIAITPGMVVDGTNVLAIHGMNKTVGGSDFLVSPVLTAAVMDTTGTQRSGYFESPTPGQANSGGEIAGPAYVEVTDKPDRPLAGTDLVITAHAVGTEAPLQSVKMFYRVMFGNETMLDMADDGVAPDAVAGDDIYSAAIPGAAFSAGEMLRWRFEAQDDLGTMTSLPAFRVPTDSHQYVGTVALDPTVQTPIPVVETFIQNPNAAGNTSGTRGAVFYLGELYDNIFFNRHGQSTGGFPKKSYNLDFNKTQRFRWHPDEPRTKDIDLLTNWADKSKARHVLSWEIMRLSGVHAHFAFTVRVEMNGEFFSTADFVEDADDIYLDRAGLNPDGALYKVYSNTLSAADSGNAGVEKKNRREENNQDLSDFINGLNTGTTTQIWDFIYDNVNIPMCVNMAAANCVIRNTDMHRKNWYIYRDTGRTDEWGLLPWDLDLAHGRKWNSTDNYFDNNLFNDGVIQVGTAVRLVSLMWSRPETRAMMERRIRTLSDRFLNHPDTPYDQRYFETRLDEMLATVDAPGAGSSDAQLDFEKWGSWIHSNGGAQVAYTNPHPDIESMAEGVERFKTEYLPGRRDEIYNRQTRIPDAQSGQIPFVYQTLVAAGAPARAIVPVDGSDGDSWKEKIFDDSGWIEGTTGIGYDNSQKYRPLLGIDVRDEMIGKNTTAYARIPFELADPSAFGALQLHLKFDDGFVAYLNGTKVLERNAPAALAWNSNSTTGTQEADVDEYEVFDISASLGELEQGSNVLAFHILNTSTGNSDCLLMPELVAGVPDSNGSVEPLIEFASLEFNPSSGNQDEEYLEMVNNNNIAVDVSDWTLSGGVEFTFAGGTVIPANSSLYVSPDVKTFRARAASPTGGESLFVVGGYKGHLSSFGETIELRDGLGALNSSTTYVGEPSDAQRFLAISEIMYHPEPDGDAEFIELINISDAVTLDLDGVQFTKGITFDFSGSAITTLAPGERVLVVKDTAAFEAAHSAGLPVAGVFALSSSLSNGGETIKLEDAEGGTIREFTYNDKDPWPTLPDTDGYSLVLIQPLTNPDHGEPTNWRASAAVGGSPGTDDGKTFSGDPMADGDGDGLSALAEYALGTSDSDPAAGNASTQSGSVEIGGDTYSTFRYRYDPAATDVTFAIETTTDLANWTDVAAAVVEVESEAQEDGTVMRVVRMADPITDGEVRYFRLEVLLN